MDTITAHIIPEPGTTNIAIAASVANATQTTAAAAWVARTLATAPPFTEERRARLATILRPAPLTLHVVV
ncbi:hypothetical protein SAMN05216368_1102 [Cryobacterium flavum]|uniref:Uncharacterized protein n=1 Tax=Cryobacterium flavum TaxID=1424659 RepID=A0A4R8V316_9MICO|nr:hypothetical protein [Cryobacterium flavum]TFB76745.1 hypothetical protein E3O21_10070 [Cryobacterium flavum]SDO07903.1 hypothetical protein SAMN05216368_1102 [Cryobacterium flavum]